MEKEERATSDSDDVAAHSPRVILHEVPQCIRGVHCSHEEVCTSNGQRERCGEDEGESLRGVNPVRVCASQRSVLVVHCHAQHSTEQYRAEQTQHLAVHVGERAHEYGVSVSASVRA